MDYMNISRVSDQSGASLLYIILEIHNSGREPSIYFCVDFGIVEKTDTFPICSVVWLQHHPASWRTLQDVTW